MYRTASVRKSSRVLLCACTLSILLVAGPAVVLDSIHVAAEDDTFSRPAGQEEPLTVLEAEATPTGPRVSAVARLSRTPLSFTENRGQHGQKTRFRCDSPGATFYFAAGEVAYLISRETDEPAAGPDRPRSRSRGKARRPTYQREGLLITARFVGADLEAEIVGEEMLPHRSNYFYGNDPAKWRTNVPNYATVRYRNIYPAIDLKYYGNGRSLKYDFVVQPGADPSVIQIEYDGVDSLSVNDGGELVLSTRFGEVIELPPYAYQEVGLERQQISCRYLLLGDSRFGFVLDGAYDASRPLYIDPELSYSTYLGGTSWEESRGIAVDDTGCAYITGTTGSADFPTAAAYDGSLGGYEDVFVTKLAATGDSLVYSTYLGGTDGEYGTDIAVDSAGCAHLTGNTCSTDFPTANAYDGSLDGGGDAFVTKLSASGDSLIYSTYLGGDNYEYSESIAVDGYGYAYIAGTTESSDFPTANAYDESLTGYRDAFVTKLSASGDALVYSTYLGGTDGQEAYGIAVDNQGCAYVAGETWSADFPTVNPYDAGLSGDNDAFITKFSAPGDSLVYSTYLGGSSYDIALGIDVNASGHAFVTGATASTDLPTVDPHQEYNNGDDDAFVTVLSGSGDSLVYSTYLGGSTWDWSGGIAVDNIAHVYVAGSSDSIDFPTSHPYQGSNNGDTDAFVAKFSVVIAGPALVYSEDFEAGLGGYTIDNNYGDGNGLWHLTTACQSAGGAHTTPTSLFYGVDPQCDYDAGQTEGVVTSPVINLVGINPPIALSFRYFLATQGEPYFYDMASVEVSENGGPFTTIAHNDPGLGVVTLADPTSTWQEALIDLTPMEGSTIEIRFRFSTGDDWWNYFDGFYIDDVSVHAAIKESVKWSQPPAYNQESPYPDCFWGWDIPSDPFLWFLVADDWACEDPRPITDLYWWGSYDGWSEPEPPADDPPPFHIGIWTDVPAGVDYEWSHPGTLIWESRAPRSNVQELPAGCDFHPDRMSSPETCFAYHYSLPEEKWFYQEAGENNIYWISISADARCACDGDVDGDGDVDSDDLSAVDLCNGQPAEGDCATCDLTCDDWVDSSDYWAVDCLLQGYPPDWCCQMDLPYGWGWKTREHFFNDGAVELNFPDPPTLGTSFNSGQPIEEPGGTPWDMAFELATVAPLVDVKWSQPPVDNPESAYPECYWGWDAFSTFNPEFGWEIAADDWACTDPRPISGVRWWGSYEGWSDIEPPPKVAGFHIGVWTDVPAGVDEDFSHPGTLIWEWWAPLDDVHERFAGCDFHPDYMAEPDTCFGYHFAIPQGEWFYQDPDANDVYWLSISAVYGDCPCDGDVDGDLDVDHDDVTAADLCDGQPPIGDCEKADVWCDGLVDSADSSAVNCLAHGNPPENCCPTLYDLWPHPWGWKAREHFFSDAAVWISDPRGPTVGAEYAYGGPIDPWDLAFELTTPASGEPEACCYPDASCQDELAGNCWDNGGVAQGPATSCDPGPSSFDVIYIDDMDVTMCEGCGTTIADYGFGLIVNTSSENITASDASSLSYEVVSSVGGIRLRPFLSNLPSFAPIVPGEALGSVISPRNEVLLTLVDPSETFRNTAPAQVLPFQIERDIGNTYVGDVFFDVTMAMGSEAATFQIHAYLNLGPHGLSFLGASRTSSTGAQCPMMTACCHPNGSCQTEEVGACVPTGGDPAGPGTTCLGDADGNGVDDACESCLLITDPEPIIVFAAVDSDADSYPDVVADGQGSLFVFWATGMPVNNSGTDLDIALARSEDVGDSWSYVLVNNDADSDDRGDRGSEAATDGQGNWVVAWEAHDNDTGYDSIMVSHSTDGGDTWADPTVVSVGELNIRPQVATDASGAWAVVWEAGSVEVHFRDIMFARSADIGETWTHPIAVNTNFASGSGGNQAPQIAADGQGNWLVTWFSWDDLGGPIGNDADIHMSRSTDYGAPNHNCCDTGHGAGCSHPSIEACVCDFVTSYCCDMDWTYLCTQYVESNGCGSCTGTFWTDPVALNNNADSDTGEDEWPHLVTDRLGNWMTVWMSDDDLGGTIGNDYDVFVASSTDNGVTWTDPITLNTNAASDGGYDYGVQPRLATDRDGTWVAVWPSADDPTWPSESDLDILVSRSVNNGANWSPPAPLNTNAASDAGHDDWPSIAADGQGNWLAAWASDDDLGGTIETDLDVLFARLWMGDDDCNDNGVHDGCEIVDGAIGDCQTNGIPDDCDIADCPPEDPTCQDCQGNTVPDECDIAACSGDPACEDCNSNGVPDGCDIADCTGAPACGDCNSNGIPDGCDIAACTGDPACDDCNGNGVPDWCDIQNETSPDDNTNGIPDECEVLQPPLPPDPDPFGSHMDKNRYISMVIPDNGTQTAIRVQLTLLHDPAEPADAPDFGSWEGVGHYRWVNTLDDEDVVDPFHTCPDSPVFENTFRCAVLGCEPEYRDWATELGGEVLHVTGAAVVPSSQYDAAQLDVSCAGNEDSCPAVSEELSISTALFGNVDDDPQLNVLDVAEIVDHLKGIAGSLFKPRVHLRPDVPDALDDNVSVLDVATAVDALKSKAYGFAGAFGPCTDCCPGEAPCPSPNELCCQNTDCCTDEPPVECNP